MANRPMNSRPCLLAGMTLAVLLLCGSHPASARENDLLASLERLITPGQEADKRTANASVVPSRESRSVKGPYYVDFRARTAASWGHAFVWYGKTSERAVEVAGLTPAGDTVPYVLGHLTWVPSETKASYGDLDPQYLLASYRVYLNEADAKRVFAYIKKLQASSPVWNAQTTNCTGFISDIAEYMGLKVPHRWQRPENFVNNLKAMNDGRQMVRLSAQ
ncbi:MAG: hypothetical protein ABW175_03155 [Bradyrhizobium sp.]